jgi:predicted ATP-binding protein involved in virulence
MFKSTNDSRIDRLNNLVLRLAKGDNASFGALSKGERCYVALASNRADLLASINCTIPEALARLGDVWSASLISSWQHAGNLARYESSMVA